MSAAGDNGKAVDRDGALRKRPLVILLAEDNEDDVFMIRKAFEQANLTAIIHVVEDGEEAMLYLTRQGRFQDAGRPGMVLLDINMPRMDGFEVLRRVKADPDLRRLPVVMLSTSEREEDIARSYAGGACSHITKPFDFVQYRDMVRQFERYWDEVARLPV